MTRESVEDLLGLRAQPADPDVQLLVQGVVTLAPGAEGPELELIRGAAQVVDIDYGIGGVHDALGASAIHWPITIRFA